MKTVSIIAIAIFALVAVCSSAPIVDQQAEVDARLDIYNDFLAGLFSGLVQTTVGSVSNLLNQLITTNPLGIGKRDAEDDLASRAGGFQFIYDNILQDLFSGLVTNSFNHLSNTLTNLIQTNPLGIGKREAEDDLAARVAIWEFLQQNILNELLSGLATNTMNHLSGSLNNLLQGIPGIGKRDAEGDLASRVSGLSFIYDNILQDLFSGLVSNTFNHLSNTLTNLIQTNPLGIGKREAEDDLAARVAIWEFLQQNILNELFSGLATNTMNHLSSSLNNLLQGIPGIGKRSVDIQQAQTIIAQTVSTLIEKFKTFAHQVSASLSDRQKLTQLVQATIADIKSSVAHLAQQLSQLIPSAITNEVAQALALIQSTLVFWTSGLAGSLGPVIGPFRP
jgi:hypothetical protein